MECPSGKKSYASPQEAHEIAQHMGKRKHQHSFGKVYRCKFADCKQWHISSSKGHREGKGSPSDLEYGWWRKKNG